MLLALALALVLGDDPITPKSVEADGMKLRVKVGKLVKTGKKPKPHGRDAVLATLPLEGAKPYVITLRDETLVRAHMEAAGARSESPLFRVAKDGTTQRFALPVNDRAWAPTICDKRWLVAALEVSGTLVFDLETNKLVKLHAGFGRFGNALSFGPTCSPDGKYAAVPTPYGARVTIVRLEDAAVVANIPVDAPASVDWSGTSLTLRPQKLPYE